MDYPLSAIPVASSASSAFPELEMWHISRSSSLCYYLEGKLLCVVSHPTPLLVWSYIFQKCLAYEYQAEKATTSAFREERNILNWMKSSINEVWKPHLFFERSFLCSFALFSFQSLWSCSRAGGEKGKKRNVG